MWTLVIAMATVALGAAGFIANIVGIEEPSGGTLALIALLILLAGTAVNLVGRRALKIFMIGSIIAEVIGSVVLGTWLLLFHRHNSLSVLFEGGGAEFDTLAYLTGPFMLAVAFIGWSFVGFESAGSIAEEVHEPAPGPAQGRAVLAGVHRAGRRLLQPGDHPGHPRSGRGGRGRGRPTRSTTR